MKKFLTITASLALAASAVLASGSSASADTLTFDSAACCTVSVVDGAYTFTLPVSAQGEHFGDGTGSGQNLSWHASPNNLLDADAVMTRTDAQNFSLTSVLVNAFSGTTSVVFSAAGYANQVFTSTGTYALPFLNVSSVTIDIGQGSASFDNFVVSAPSAIPVPASLPLLFAGFGALGWMRRRKS